MNTPAHAPLGKPVSYGGGYDPTLLCPMPRADNRAALGIDRALPFVGVDIWNAYELSWLDASGKPQVALAEFRIDAGSPAIVESKSFKLYLNSYAQTRLPDVRELATRLRTDLDAATGSSVGVHLVGADEFDQQTMLALRGTSLDAIDIDMDHYGPPQPAFLCSDHSDGREINETLVSHLLKSNCPVTGQPDWASVQIRYRGTPIDHAGLLRYLVSYREHSGFHEDCVERIFVDIKRQCAPVELDVYARYTRRGGLDINPWRSSTRPQPVDNGRSARQ